MEIRVLEYFLALAREGSVSAAAASLHVSQPTLSRQLIGLERELGCTLFERGRRGIELTEDGMRLRRRAREIVELAHATRSELLLGHGEVAGEVSIGCAETHVMGLVARLMRSMREDYPAVTFNIVSDTAEQVAERVSRGLLDFGLLLREAEGEGLNFLRLDTRERTVVVARAESPLAAKERVGAGDLADVPLILPASYREGVLRGVAEGDRARLTVVARYNLVYNAVRMAQAGIGDVVSLAGLVDVLPTTGLVVRPLDVDVSMPSYVVWKPLDLRTRACEVFLRRCREELPVAAE